MNSSLEDMAGDTLVGAMVGVHRDRAVGKYWEGSSAEWQKMGRGKKKSVSESKSC